ncbi:helix-turn-helix domain-containing protein [Halosolutus amylolyticus]|uniref:Helix-turn-helix domain-containing protein n=1 Tax=Halosolutus amylolyticus TaxID=2932267 RepID=A0ABD5PUH6_9EURY|nr:helix-turn-helix domain-containing protein [Halosolutus amylolyticus]
MSNDRERNSHGQYADRIPAETALEAFDDRDDLGRPLTADDVMETLDCSRRTAHNKLTELVEDGALRTRKIGARGRVWWVPMEASSEPQPATDRTGAEAPPRAVQEAMETIDLPGTGATLEARREALLASYEFLIDHPSARKSDFLENVYPDHPAEFETAEGWWNAIQPALKELPGVDPPEERGHIWNFLGSDRFTPTLG